MWKRQKQTASSSSSEVDFGQLCEDIVKRIEEVSKRRMVLNERQCRFLAWKLSCGIACIREAVECCEKHKPDFGPLLAALYRYYEKAEVLLTHCAEEDWCAAAVFQRGNTASFDNITEHVNFLGSEILKCAAQHASMDISTLKVRFEKNVGYHVSGHDYVDEGFLRMRLDLLSNEQRNSTFAIFGFLVRDQVDLTQHLARYLLKKNKFHSGLRNPLSSSEDLKGYLKGYLWEKDGEPA